MSYNSTTASRGAYPRQDGAGPSTGIPFWDMMFSFGKASREVLSAYAPPAEQDTRPARGATEAKATAIEVIPIGEETLNVGTRLVAGATTRVRRVVVETPVEKGVSLREERVVVERRKPTGAASTATAAILTDTAIEMSDSFEVVEVWKSVRVTEEVVLRREVTQRHETVRDTVRRDEVVVEEARRAAPAPRSEVKAALRAVKPEAAQLAADMKDAAERFETNVIQQEKTLATLHETLEAEKGAAKVEPKRVEAHAHPAPVEQPKAPAFPKANSANDGKGAHNPKG